MTTKILALGDALGNLVRFTLLPDPSPESGKAHSRLRVKAAMPHT